MLLPSATRASFGSLPAFLWMLLVVPLQLQADWPRFRGPDGDGHAPAKARLLVEWSEQQGVQWKVPVPGKGHSSPVCAEGRIWLTTAVTQTLSEEQLAERLENVAQADSLDVAADVSLRAVCFELESGRMLHDLEVFTPENPEPIHYTNSYASPTPVLADGRVYVHFGTYGNACLDAVTGEILWRNTELHVDHQNGPGSSPVLWGDLLIVNYDGIDQQFVAAFHTRDGRVAWKTERSGELHPRPDMQKAYATPAIVETQRGPELISPGADWVYGYDPGSGSELWKVPYGELGFSTVPCPVVGHDMVYVCTSFMKSKLLAIELGGAPAATREVAWTAGSQIPKKPSLILVEGNLYVGNDSGIVTCLDALSGEEKWRGRIGGNYSASPIYSNGRLYFFSQEGKTTVLRAGDVFEVIAENELPEGCHGSPAVVGDSLVLRTDNHLWRIGQ